MNDKKSDLALYQNVNRDYIYYRNYTPEMTLKVTYFLKQSADDVEGLSPHLRYLATWDSILTFWVIVFLSYLKPPIICVHIFSTGQ